MDSRETGLFRYDDPDTGDIYYMTIYVDDALCTGPSRDKVKSLVSAVLGKFKGRVIEPTYDSKGRQVRDVLG
jgi:hypothetical protein